MRETRRFETRVDLWDIHNIHFPRFPYAFDDPTPKDVGKAKDGLRKVENMSIGDAVDYVQEMINNTSYVMKKLEPLKKITNPGDMIQQLSRLRTEKSRVDSQFHTLSQAKTKVDLRLTSMEWELEALRKGNTLLKSDKELMQVNHDRLAESISTKDKELGVTNKRASLATQEKTLLEAEVRENRQKLTEAESIRAFDKVSLKSYEKKQQELQAEVDRLNRLKVNHTEVALIEERSAEVE